MRLRRFVLVTIVLTLTVSLLIPTSIFALTPPDVDTGTTTDITMTSATVSGNLTAMGAAAEVYVLFEYGTSTSYGSATSTQIVNGTGTFSANLTGLNSGTTYHFRAIADGDGTDTGNDMTFTTVQDPPTVTTGNATNITTTSATVSGNLTSMGGATPVYVSFEYGLTTSYGSNTTAQAMTGTGVYNANLTGLSANTIYHFRAKAIGDSTVGDIDGSFTTLALASPEVSTSAATGITTTSATVSGNLTSLGTATAVNVSFEYGLTTSYGSNTTAQAMTGRGVYSANLTGLTPGTEYHFRAKAVGDGTATGADGSFTSVVLASPEVSTSAATGVTSYITTVNGNLTALGKATISGNLTSLGTATAVNVSFEYGLTASYGSTTTAQTMMGTGVYSSNLVGLSANTTYHFRARAVGDGTDTGGDLIFTTPVPPTVNTGTTSSITMTSATVSGSLTALGTATTVDAFFEYGLTTNYGSTTTVQAMTGTGVFSADLTGLTPNTTYHFRARAVGGGTVTGIDGSFTTLAQTSPTVSTSRATGVTNTTAILYGYLIELGTTTTVDVSFEYGSTTNYGNTTTAQTMTSAGAYSANLTGLTPGTEYHFRARAVGDGTNTGGDLTFIAGTTPPVISTITATDFTTTSATVSGNLTSLGTAATANVSFEYGLTTSYGSTTTAQATTVTGVFSANLTGLTPNTTYHFRATVDAGAHGTATGVDMTFNTEVPIPPIVTTTTPTAVTSTAATLNGNLTTLGSAATANISFEYGLTTSYGSTTTAQAMAGTGAYSANLTGLTPGTEYHFRAKADAGTHGGGMGGDLTFTTLTPPTVSTGTTVGITTTSATVNGNLTTLGTAATANVSFEYGLTTSYGSTTTVQAMAGTGAYSANLTGLNSGATYHFRAKAVGDGTATGVDTTFTTEPIPPIVTTTTPTAVTSTAATLNGNLTTLGSVATANVSFEYGLTISYGSTTTAQAMTGTGVYSANLTGLSANTTYHFRAKADAGTHGGGMGGDLTFTTLAPPTVSTGTTVGITTTSATVNGNLTSLGTAATANVSFEYGLTTSYGSTTTVQTANSTGAYSANLTGLNSGATYHFRAKAVGDGTATGVDTTFTTLELDPPTVSTAPASGVTGNTATLYGYLASLGTAVTANVSFEYGLTTSYGSNTTAQAMTGTGVYSANLTGLSANTTYHFRAKAVGDGTVIGIDGSFTSLALASPEVSTSAATGITTTSATVSGNLTSLGTAATANVSFEYGLTTNYGSNTTAQAMTGTGVYSANLTGLSANTTYHFRAKAVGDGTDTGDDTTFTTTAAPAPPPVDGGGGSSSGGGGGGGAIDDARITGFGDAIRESGELIDDIVAMSLDNKVSLDIPAGTFALNRNNVFFTSVRITTLAEPPVESENIRMIGLAYELTPDRVTFNPPITLTFSYLDSDIPQGVSEENLFVALWDEDSQEWIKIESTIDLDANTISAMIDHFSIYTIMAHTSPSRFTITDLSVTPIEVNIGENISVNVLVTNIGDLTGTYRISVAMDEKPFTSKEVTLNGGESKIVIFEITSRIVGQRTIQIGSLQVTYEVLAPPPTPADFLVDNLIVFPTDVTTDEKVRIIATVTNTGGAAGSYEVILRIDNRQVNIKEVTIDGGESEVVAFTVVKDKAGAYTVDIDGQIGSFVVRQKVLITSEEETPTQPTPLPIPTPMPEPVPTTGFKWWILSLIAGVVLVVLLVYYFLKRKQISLLDQLKKLMQHLRHDKEERPLTSRQRQSEDAGTKTIEPQKTPLEEAKEKVAEAMHQWETDLKEMKRQVGIDDDDAQSK